MMSLKACMFARQTLGAAKPYRTMAAVRGSG